MSKTFRIRWGVIVCLCTCLSLAQCGPIQRYVRVMREVYPEIEPEKAADGNQPQVCVVGDVVYEAEEAVPADQPCLKCKCQPPGVHCEAIRCLKKPGCRAIHKPNKCCPDYQCECEHEGKIYGNGERLESKPGGECQVCYCRGGEVQCTEVSCYIRTDCEGKTVPGQCCPKYEHCPAIELSSGKVPPLKVEAEEHEVTTRIISDPITNSSVENEIAETTTTSEENLASLAESTTTPKAAEPEDPIVSGEAPRITIHEIIPEIKEIPITESPKPQLTQEAVIPGQLLVEEKVPILEDDNRTNDVEDSELESSELSEVFQHPPPVLRIGDQLLFLKKGEFIPEKDASTPSPVFTIIGAEGLQRGDIETIEHPEQQKEVKETIKNDTKGDFTQTILNDNTTIDVAVILADSTPEEIDEEDEGVKNETLSIASTTKKPPEEEAKKIDEVIQSENPAYPPIPEIMSQQGAEYVDHSEIVENKDADSSTADPKILPDILPFRGNSSGLSNVSIASWLKIDKEQTLVNEKAALPEEVLKEVAVSDFDVTTVEAAKEGRRSFDSTTSPPLVYDGFRDEDLLKYGAILESDPLVENQVKKLADDGDVTGSSNLPQERSRSTETVEDTSSSSGESTTAKDHPIFTEENASISSEEDKPKKDVEIIDTALLISNISEENSKEARQDRVEKRTVSSIYDPESEKIFQELDTELHLLNGDPVNSKSDPEEKKEAEMIFKELLDEVNNSTSKRTQQTQTKSGGKESDDVLQRVSNAIARFQLKEARQSLDVNILAILRDFFTSQYKSYKDV